MPSFQPEDNSPKFSAFPLDAILIYFSVFVLVPLPEENTPRPLALGLFAISA